MNCVFAEGIVLEIRNHFSVLWSTESGFYVPHLLHESVFEEPGGIFVSWTDGRLCLVDLVFCCLLARFIPNRIHALPRVSPLILSGLHLGPPEPIGPSLFPRLVRLQRAIPPLGPFGILAATE